MEDVFEELMNFSSNKGKSATKLKPSEKLINDIKSQGYDMSQLEGILKVRGNQLIVSCAGSGKTTALIFKIMYDIKTGYATEVKEINGNPIRVPQRTWVSTFLKSGSVELENSLRRWNYKLGCVDTSKQIRFSTLHAEFKRALNGLGVSTEIISESENQKLLKSVVKTYALYNADGNQLNSENFRDLQSALTYTRNRLDDRRYEQDIYNELGIGKVLVDSILRDWKAARSKKGLCDFEDLQESLYNECYVAKNQDVLNYLSRQYSFIYIDEFQDTSQIQYALLLVYGAECKQVVAIGDDDQTIYSWRGSCIDVITKNFKEDFNPVVSELSMNYRCPARVLNAIIPCISNNKTRFEKSLRYYREGGEFRIGTYPNYNHMVTELSNLVAQDIKEGMSVAILCRVNSDGLMPAMLMDKLSQFSFSISGDGMTLDSYIGRLALSIVRLFCEKHTQAVKNALNLLTWDGYCVNSLIKVLKNNNKSIWDIDEKDLSYSCPEIASRLIKWRNWRKDLGEVQALKSVLQDYRTNIFAKDTQFNDVVRSVLLGVESLLGYFSYEYVEDFLMELEDINERLCARRKKTGTQIQIATVHEFKGKEADSVYIWNASNGVFPHKDSMDTDEEIEEERRVFYIANTRARKRSTIMHLKNKESMFIKEMDLSDAQYLQSNIHGVLVNKDAKDCVPDEIGLRRFETMDSEEDNDYWEGDSLEV